MDFKENTTINSVIILIISIKLIFKLKWNKEGWNESVIYFVGLILFFLFW
jgi:hypothetical protein